MKNTLLTVKIVLSILFLHSCNNSVTKNQTEKDKAINKKVEQVLSQMTLQEKLGQMQQIDAGIDKEIIIKRIKNGELGSILNVSDVDAANEFQRVATEESRMKIPLIIGRDVIHGYKTVFPIPLGQASSWNPNLIEQAAAIAAEEAASAGINWTFAPMMDVTRDPRWGRVAETLGEDTYLTSILSAAMVKGFQGDLSAHNTIAACAKHYVGYGASESGKDYNTTNIPENELRNIHLPPFKNAVDAGVATIMSAFNDIDGIPASGNVHTLKTILKDEWGFKGFVVSDWESMNQMIVHGFCKDNKEVAYRSALAQTDMEMTGTTYNDHLEELIKEGKISEKFVDDAVRRILKVKFQLGLFDDAQTDVKKYPQLVNDDYKKIAKEIATQSIVLLKNKNDILPLSAPLNKVAIIGPMADEPYEQMGTWTFDGDEKHTITPLVAIKDMLGKNKVLYSKGLETTRSTKKGRFAEAKKTAQQADVVLLFAGEEAFLSGESNSRANINLPGAQEDLVKEIASTNKPIILIVMAGRPIVLTQILDKVDAVFFAWHPGTMGGEALADLIFGNKVPSAKLPISIPRSVGQIPVYYSYKNTGRPTLEPRVELEDYPDKVKQLSTGFTSRYLDEELTPLFPFGYGLSYTTFNYSDIKLSSSSIKKGENIIITAKLTNTGNKDAEEIAQLYIRDLVGNITRPVKELKGFQRVFLKAGETKTIEFTLTSKDLMFYSSLKKKWILEEGDFEVWIGENSATNLKTKFELLNN